MNRILGSWSWGRRLTRRVGAVAATCLLAFSSSLAWAAEEATLPDADKPWLQWLCLLGFMGLCCAIAFKNPKRSHMT